MLMKFIAHAIFALAAGMVLACMLGAPLDRFLAFWMAR